MGPSDGLFTLTLAYSGIRFGEAAGLRRRFVDLVHDRLVVASSLSDADGQLTLEEPKSHQHRVVTLPHSLVDRLGAHMGEQTAWPEPDSFVFMSPAGLPIRHQNFMRRVWGPACEATGLSLTPHDLRASHATWLYDAGWSPVEIAARLGHSKATVTTKH